MDLKNLTITSLHEGLLAKEFSAVEVTKEYIESIEEFDANIGAYLSVDAANAIVEAEKVDVAIAKGNLVGFLAGVPMGIKDAILVRGMHATAGSKILEKYEAAYDATVIARLRKEGAVILGKTNLDEFAMGSSTENSAFKLTKNPHDPTRVPGGSSGGSAAALAANMALAALGSDTGGSIRQPASFCGVVGLKPTYGAVSRFGLIAMSSSLDQIGPFAKTVEDAAIIFKAIAGVDRYDSTSAPVVYGDELLSTDFDKLRGMTIGLPREYFIEGVEPEVTCAIESVIEFYKKQGIKFKEISLPHTKYALSDYYIVMPAEVSSNLARYDGIRYARISADQNADERRYNIRENPRSHQRVSAPSLLELYRKSRSEGMGAETKRRIILGTFVLSSGYYDAYYAKAQKVRALIKKDFTDAFKDVDIILTPVAPTRAFKFGEKTADPLQMYLSDVFTIPVNLAGLPGISIPVRTQINADQHPRGSAQIGNPRASALPTGFQLIGRPWREVDLFNAGRFYEEQTRV